MRIAAAALTEHPGTALDRVETDGPGLHRVHLVDWFGGEVVVHVDGDLTVQDWLTTAR